MHDKKKIGVLCYYIFPQGMAPTTRILAYCKGLQLNGVETEVYTYKVALPESKEPLSGCFNGVKYFITYKWSRNHSRLFKLMVGHAYVIYRTVKSIVKSNRKTRFDYIFLSLDHPVHLSLFSSLLWLSGIKCVFIGDEFPEPIRKLHADVPYWYLVLYKFAYQFICRRILMTENLKSFYDQKVCRKPTFILNSIIDSSRFADIRRRNVIPRFLCYMGNMELAKDNVDNIIRAFSLIKDKFPDLELHLYGLPSDRDRLFIEKLILECDCAEKAVLKGRAPFEKVPQILADAAVLVSSQPDTTRAKGGFPTKLAEYMMTGVPVVLTQVGEISSYVSDSDTAFLVEPGNPEAYAEKLEHVLEHYSDALAVASRAYSVAMANWGCQDVAKNLISFLYQ